MTAPYNNSQIQPQVDYYEKLNPYREEGLFKYFGDFPLGEIVNNPNQQYIPIGLVYAAAMGVNVADWHDDFADPGDATTTEDQIKIKYLTGYGELTNRQYQAFKSGDRMAVAKVEDMFESTRAIWAKTLERWIIGYLGTYVTDPAWISLLGAKAATGTLSNPVDICSTPGTIEPLTANVFFGAAANRTLEVVEAVFGDIIDQFTDQVDSVTGRAMLPDPDPEIAGKDILVLLNPKFKRRLMNAHPSDGTALITDITYAQQIANYGITLKGTNLVDSAYDAAEDGTLEMIALARPKDNFKVGIGDLHITEWKEFESREGHYWFIKMWQPIVCFRRPFRISSTIRKAEYIVQVTGLNDEA